MRHPFRLAVLIGAMILAAAPHPNLAVAQTAPAKSLDEQLKAKFPPGTGLVIRQSGILAVNPQCSFTFWTTYKKDGRLHPPSSFGQSFTQGVSHPSNGGQDCPTRVFPAGWRVNLLDLKIFPKVARVAFDVQECDACNGSESASFKAQVVFEFAKGFLETAEVGPVQDAILHVFSIDASANAAPAAPVPQGPDQPAAPGAPPPALGSLYVSALNPADRLQLNTDGTFSMVQAGRNYQGTFTIAGNKLMMRIGGRREQLAGILLGDTLLDVDGPTWAKQQGAPAEAVPTIAPPALGSLYVSAQNQADRLQLNPDGSFSLQEGGQPFSGAYSVTGTTLKLHIVELQKDAEIAINGDSLTVNGAENWVQTAQPPDSTAGSKGSTEKASGSVLQNQDIIKMAQAGLDDSIIISKIKSSRCQFDTAPDTLIELKKSGISSAVLKAMTEAANP